MKICPKCNKYSENDDAVFCNECGSKMVDEGRSLSQSNYSISKKPLVIYTIGFTVLLLFAQWSVSYALGKYLAPMLHYPDSWSIIYFSITSFVFYMIFFAGLKICGLISGIIFITIIELADLLFPDSNFAYVSFKYMSITTIAQIVAGFVALFVIWALMDKRRLFKRNNYISIVIMVAISLIGKDLLWSIDEFIRPVEYRMYLPAYYYFTPIVDLLFSIIGGTLGALIATKVQLIIKKNQRILLDNH